MKDYEYYKKLAEKKRLTAEDKKTIADEAEVLGIFLNKDCPNCYRDAAIQIALAHKPKEEQTAGEYKLHKGIDIWLDSYKYGMLHICESECTEANVQRWLAAGVPTRYFKSMPK